MDAEKPVPKDDEVLIKNHATEISPADIAFRSGKPFIARFFTGLLRPKGIPGDVLAGEIEAVGKNVSKFRKGDRVFGSRGRRPALRPSISVWQRRTPWSRCLQN
ncbi:MAG: alcohol dehydrogenase catalytic domain-containing protein [Methanomassiliicoccales archaeon]|nr:alcohol dehydrogenase catalytic domain-containing protein [Methanomassiliicoccales archaeon]